MRGKLKGKKLLEEFALQFINQSEGDLFKRNLLLIAAGAILAVFAGRSETRLPRAPYFVGMNLIGFSASASEFTWLGAIPAMEAGYLWVFALISLVVPLAGGFFHYRISMARSRDAYGHAWAAFLGFIPVVNILFLLERSKDETLADHALAIPLFSGGRGVLIGFILFIGNLIATAGMSVYVMNSF